VKSSIARTAEVFDSLAPAYADSFVHNALAASARKRAWRLYQQFLPASGRVADVGCGPGVDAIWLAERGYDVVAIDCAQDMLKELITASEARGVESSIVPIHGDAFEVQSPLMRHGPFDACILSFGTLNYVANLKQAFSQMRKVLKPSGILIVSSLNSHCLWDLAWHGIVLRRLAPRWRRLPSAVQVGGTRLDEWYWTQHELINASESKFEKIGCMSVGSFAPPPYSDPLFARMPRLREVLCRADRWAESSNLPSYVCDMTWVALRAK
jgi:ubiquinone/menaquinone biosynthesis C-methylase UbiE